MLGRILAALAIFGVIVFPIHALLVRLGLIRANTSTHADVHTRNNTAAEAQEEAELSIISSSATDRAELLRDTSAN